MNWLLGFAFAAVMVTAFTVTIIRGGTRLPDPKPPTPAQRHQAEQAAAAERLFPGTDADRFDGDCTDPPCSPEDSWVCGWHLYQVRAGDTERVGRHRAIWELPLDDQPSEVIAAIITDLEDRRGQW